VTSHIVFDGTSRERRPLPGTRRTQLRVSSFGKTYFRDRLGRWVTFLAPRNLMAEFRKVLSFNVFSSPTARSRRAAEYRREGKPYLSRRRSTEDSAISSSSMSGLTLYRAALRAARSSRILATTQSPTEMMPSLALRLTRERGVAAIPVSVFYHDGHCDRAVLRFVLPSPRQRWKRGGDSGAAVSPASGRALRRLNRGQPVC